MTRTEWKLAAAFGGTLLVAGGLGFGACFYFSGSDPVARAFVDAVRADQRERAAAMCERPPDFAKLAFLKNGEVSVERSSAGFLNDGVRYACHVAYAGEKSAWLVLTKRNDRWSIHEATDHPPETCQGD